MATPTIQSIAARVHERLQEGSHGLGFDPTTLITILTDLFKMFGLCALTPAAAHQRATNVAKGSGFGHRLDRLRFQRIVDVNANDDEADDVAAALLDAIDGTTVAEFATAMAEAK